MFEKDATAGSSPLARGLPCRRPAYSPARSDHPRSRGVYDWASDRVVPGKGSSPLARGLRARGRLAVDPQGIIPARAGFTSHQGGVRLDVEDHPRSRGVYSHDREYLERDIGSSPLARGLRMARLETQIEGGIIPARAGFTTAAGCRRSPTGDHPRSRGVYLRPCRSRYLPQGSSPLARGLRCYCRSSPGGAGIIPARAGFTASTSPRGPSPWDHPRSRGVYTCGSLESQRRATLPDRVCLHCRPSARSAELR